MAKYIRAHADLNNIVQGLASDIDKIDRQFLDRDPDLPAIPEHIKKHIQDAKSHLDSALIQISNAARMLIEADAEEMSKPKED